MRSSIAHRMHRAFTLIEILIVVVILGILAAIVIPQFTNASQEAQEASVHSILQTLRSQIELFEVQNAGSVFAATGATGWDQLINGGYILDAPKNPIANNAVIISAGGGAGEGWCYCVGTGTVTTVRPLDTAGAVMMADTTGSTY